MLAEWRAADNDYGRVGEEKLVLGGSVCSGGWVEFTKYRYSKKRIWEQDGTSCLWRCAVGKLARGKGTNHDRERMEDTKIFEN